MDPMKVGQLIKKIRIDNHLTQKDLADKYNVTYQAVSKWENGINLPDISLLTLISNDFNVSLDEILNGKIKKKKMSLNTKLIIIFGIIICLGVLFFFLAHEKEHKVFHFKTLSSSCNDFEVSGSLAYNKEKSSIYISDINYCGGDDNNIYEKIECSLYEKSDDNNSKISSCKEKSNIKLEDYLKEIEVNIDNYSKTCQSYNNDSLYLEINATLNNKLITYKIPLNVNNNCPKEN